MALQRWRNAGVPAVSFASGAAGLVFEMVWLHRAGLVFGDSVWAATIVLSSFMGGLAIGNLLIAGFAAGIRDKFRAYAALEATVAVTGIALTYLLPRITPLLMPVFATSSNPATVNLMRLTAAFTLLLVPATAMGATLPLLVGAVAFDPARIGASFGRLYGWNTLGAVAGVLVAEVVLVDRLGVAGSAWFAGLLDLAAVTGALAIARTNGDFGEQRRLPQHRPAADQLRMPLAACLTGAALSGCLLVGLEVVWFRFLTMYVLSTTLAASEMLAVVLAGIGLGGIAASRWLVGRFRLAVAIPTASLLTGAAVISSYFAFQAFTTGTQVGDWTRVLWFAFVLTGPASFCSGCLLTLLAEGIAPRINEGTRASAALTLANTAGAMCGPPIAAFVILPTIGMDRAFAYAALGYLIVALVTVIPTWRVTDVGESRRLPPGAWLPIQLAVFTCLVGYLLVAGMPYRATALARVTDPYTGDGAVVVSTSEGPSETIFVMQQQWLGQPVYSRLVTNGFSMTGTTVAAMRYMRFFAYWPMLMHAGPLRRALVICYGVGVTVGAVTDNPALESLDVVEISRDIVGASDVIYPPGSRPLKDPRVHLHLDDGRFFLQTTRDRFDLITGEPPPPRTPGAVNIYTREYFRLIYDRLAEGGMTTYWLPVARPEPGTDVSTIVRAFCDVFEDCSLWNGTPSDLMLVGTRHASGPVTEASFAAPWQRPELAARLREIGFENPGQVGATFIGDAGYLRELTANAPPLTDDFPQRLLPVPTRPSLSDPHYRSEPAVLALFNRVLDPERAMRAFAASPLVAHLWPAALRTETLDWFGVQGILNRALWGNSSPLGEIADLHTVLTTTTLRTLPLWLLGSDDVKQRIAEGSALHSAETEYARGVGALARRDYLGAAAHLGEAERLGLRSATVGPLQVYAMCMAGDLTTARLLARGIKVRDQDTQHFVEWLATHFNVGPLG